MSKLQHVLHCDGCTDRSMYLRNIILLAAGKTIIDLQVMHLRPDLCAHWSWPMSWFDPFVLVRPWLEGEAPFLVCLTTFCFFAALVWNSVHRARHAGRIHWAGLLTAVPFVWPLTVIALALIPGKKRSVWDIV